MGTCEPLPTYQDDCLPEISEPFLASGVRDFPSEADFPNMTPPQSLDKLPPTERQYNLDSRNEANRQDVEHLCKVWAEVGRAILMRRRQPADEQENVK